MFRCKPREVYLFAVLTAWYFILNWRFGAVEGVRHGPVERPIQQSFEPPRNVAPAPKLVKQDGGPAPARPEAVGHINQHHIAQPEHHVKAPGHAIVNLPGHSTVDPPKHTVVNPPKQVVDPPKQVSEPPKQVAEPPKQVVVNPPKQVVVEASKNTAVSPPKHNFAQPVGISKTIVVASTKNTSTGWVKRELPDWNAAIYISDDPTAALYPGVNKGNEANVYLKWVIDNYDNLPDVAVFVHGHQDAYHTDKAFKDTPETVRRLKLDYVKKVGYQTLTCWEAPGCNLTAKTFWNYAHHFKGNNGIWQAAFDEPAPDIVVCPKFAQFAVSKEAIRARSKANYEKLRNWILETQFSNFTVGRWMEHMWHHLFGKKAAFCQSRPDCLAAYDMSDKTPAEVYKAVKAFADAGWENIM